jgi:hypothetical protein
MVSDTFWPTSGRKASIDELRERAELLSTISKVEDDPEWTDLDERAALLTTIQKAEE